MSLTITITVPQSPEQVYDAVVDVAGWWTGEISGPTAELGQEFTYRYQDKHRSTHRVQELVRGHRVVWLTTDAELPFADDPAEWIGTRQVFDITPAADGTELRFTHEGLVPELDCYDSCSNAWGYYIRTSLSHRIRATAA
jgi:uncharacterized protein YndB with AHSA1/START domain